MSKKKNRTYNILILEDEPVVLNMLDSLLAKEGYRCFLANTGEKALEIVEKEDIDLFLTDIVILSAFLDQWDKEVFKDCKIDRWISKPAKPKVLFQVIRELLQDKEKAESN